MESQETLKLYFVSLLQVLGRKKMCHFYKLEFLLAHVFSFLTILKCKSECSTYHGNVYIFWMAYIKKIKFLYSDCNFMSGKDFANHLCGPCLSSLPLSVALWLFRIVIQLTIAKNKIQVLCRSADRAIQISWFSVH